MSRLATWPRALVCALALTLAACASQGSPASPIFQTSAVDGLPTAGHFDRQAVLTVELKNKTTMEATSDGRQVWALHNDLRFRTPAGDLITLPRGMSTDLASIPRWGRVVLSPDGTFAQAALPHDLCYQSNGTFEWSGHVGHTWLTHNYSRAECDQLLRDGAKSLNISPWKVTVIYYGVRIGGAGGFGH